MKVTVLGGSGFLGSHVADQLTTEGHSVRVFDLRESPYLHADQQMIVGDLRNFDDVKLAIDGSQAVFNFAALADIDDAANDPIAATQVNVLGNAHALEACRQTGVERYVFASTIYVYSRHGGFYRCSKQASELFIEQYAQSFGLDFTVLRFGSLYGPRSQASNGLRRIVTSALTDGVIRYSGHPDAIREYIHVDDAAHASVMALAKEFRNEHLVITGPRSIKVADVLASLAEILGIDEGKIEYTSPVNSAHYVRTAYAYQPRPGRTFVTSQYVDFGQGILQLIEDVAHERIEKSRPTTD